MNIARTQIGTLVLVMATCAVSAAAQDATPQPAVTLALSGTFENHGEFEGTLTINRFDLREGEIVAVGVVSGSLRRNGHRIGTVLVAEVTFPVDVRVGGVTAASGRSAPRTQYKRIVLPAGKGSSVRVVPAQAPGACPVVDVALGATNIDVLGGVLTTDPIAIRLEGTPGTPLGDLICAVEALLGNVAGLVRLLSTILGVLTGLLGGLTGGLGGLPIP
jgi:hypothetical protein